MRGEATPRPGVQKGSSGEEAQTEKRKPVECQRTGCHGDRCMCRTLECLELHERLQHPQGKEKVRKMKEGNCRVGRTQMLGWPKRGYLC